MAVNVPTLVKQVFDTASGIFGKDVFRRGTYYEVVPGVGEQAPGKKKYSITAVFSGFSQDQTEFSDVISGDLLVKFPKKSVTFTPKSMDTIFVDAFGDFTVIQIKTDAANAVWKLQVRRK